MGLSYDRYSGSVSFKPVPVETGINMAKLIVATFYLSIASGIYYRDTIIESYIVGNDGNFIVWQ